MMMWTDMSVLTWQAGNAALHRMVSAKLQNEGACEFLPRGQLSPHGALDPSQWQHSLCVPAWGQCHFLD